MNVFKQRITRFVNAEGKRVPKGAPGAEKVTEKSRLWYGQYTDSNGKRVRVSLCSDKRESLRLLAHHIDRERKKSAGVEVPEPKKGNATLAEDLKDYRRYLESKGNVPGHVEKTVSQCAAILKGCGFRQPEDVTEGAVVGFLAGLRDGGEVEMPSRKERWYEHEVAEVLGITTGSVRRKEYRGLLGGGEGRGMKRTYPRSEVERLLRESRKGIGITTSNHYVVAFKSFFKWMVRQDRIRRSPVEHLSEMSADTDRRHERRAMTPDELARFIKATAEGKTFRGLTGADRLTLYLVGAHTGLRASELASLTPSSFDFEAKVPSVTVEAAYSKHRRKDVLPLRKDIAEEAKRQCQGKEGNENLWPGKWPAAGAEMVRRDLEAAGIPYRDGKGRVFDFHALRHSFITLLATSGVHPKVAQTLARHSTIVLTMDHYTHLQALDVAGDLEKLPRLPTMEGRTDSEKGEVA